MFGIPSNAALSLRAAGQYGRGLEFQPLASGGHRELVRRFPPGGSAQLMAYWCSSSSATRSSAWHERRGYHLVVTAARFLGAVTEHLPQVQQAAVGLVVLQLGLLHRDARPGARRGRPLRAERRHDVQDARRFSAAVRAPSRRTGVWWLRCRHAAPGCTGRRPSRRTCSAGRPGWLPSAVRRAAARAGPRRRRPSRSTARSRRNRRSTSGLDDDGDQRELGAAEQLLHEGCRRRAETRRCPRRTR